jgi:mannose/fructose/N-acetylgalactosamine-specific phosphotransferase system component IID
VGLAAAVVGRSFLLQAAWNYRILQGTGAAFALVPVLRRRGLEPPEVDRALERHAGHFNAHPYLASFALGSLARMEMDGADPESVRRFRAALGGPLGALGDKLVWAAWLPLCSVLALALYFAGVGPLGCVLAFLVAYNAGHLTLRVWGFVQGWHAGPQLGRRLGELDLAGVAVRLEGWLAGAMGFLAGFVVVAPGLSGDSDLVWTILALAGLFTGMALGTRVWRAAAVATVAVIGLLLLAGLLT